MGTHINSEYQGDETKSGNYIVMYDIDKISVCMAMYNTMGTHVNSEYQVMYDIDKDETKSEKSSLHCNVRHRYKYNGDTCK